jgi:tRNA(Ile)-lysidine synthase
VLELVNGENGKKIDLPHNVTAIKEYEYITLTRKVKKVITDEFPCKVGKIKFAEQYEIDTERTKMFMLRPGIQLMDTKKIPSGAVWRVRQKGDKFEKFGGGTKPLRTYMIDKKIPARLRDTLPVLAKDNEVYCILGVEISDKVKVDETTSMAYSVTFKELK